MTLIRSQTHGDKTDQKHSFHSWDPGRSQTQSQASRNTDLPLSLRVWVELLQASAWGQAGCRDQGWAGGSSYRRQQRVEVRAERIQGTPSKVCSGALASSSAQCNWIRLSTIDRTMEFSTFSPRRHISQDFRSNFNNNEHVFVTDLCSPKMLCLPDIIHL